MKKKLVSLLTGIAFVVAQSGAAFGEILPHNAVVVNQPSVAAHAGTGVPVVNIVAPNSRGLSHNKYDEFNVDSKGVVLNNSLTASQSQIIGGEIEANANFTGAMASVILNEIMSAQKSLINGAVEIAGQKAVLITANPYGISVNGGIFINTEKAVFVTGVPNIADEIIKSFTLSPAGAVEIENAGLTTNDPVEIISRYTKLSGELKAKSIDIKAGNKEYALNEETGEWEIISEDPGDDPADKYAVSAWAFGSMYGNRIKIMSTENGFGVKTADNANLISDASDITINADGKIEIGAGITSKTDAQIKANDNITVSGNVTAGAEGASAGNIKIETSKALENSGIMTAHGSADIEAESVKNDNAAINAAQNIEITAAEDLSNISGLIKSGGDTIAAAGDIINDNGEINAAQNITASADSFGSADGKINAGNNITFDFNGKDVQTAGGIKAGGTLSFQNTGNLVNTGTLEGKEISLASSGAENKSGGKIISSERTKINTGEITNNGLLQSGGDMSLNASGSLTSGGIINAGGLLNILLSGNLINNFTITAKNLSVTAGNIINNNANITVEENAALKTDGIEDSNGRITSGGDLSVTINDKDFTAGGEYSAGGKLSFSGIKNFVNAGALSGGGIGITPAESFFNVSSIISSGDMKITSLAVKNQNGIIRAGNDLSISGSSLFNEKTAVTGSGTISAGNVVIGISGDIGNNSGKIESSGGMNISAANIVNKSGKLYGRAEIKGGNMTMTAGNIYNKSASIGASGNLQIKADNIVNEREADGLSFLGESVINAAALSVKGKTGESAKSFINGYGSVKAASSLSIWADNIINTAVIFPKSSGENYVLKRKVYSLGDAPGNLYAAADYAISGGGVMESLGGAELKTNRLDNISGNINAGGDLNILAEKINNAAHSVNAPAQYGGGALYASLAAGGSISGGNITITGINGTGNAAELNNIISIINAANTLKINADKIENKAVENINLIETRGISVTRNNYTPNIPYNGSYGIWWDETPSVLHSAAQAVLSGGITQITGAGILNESSVIEGRSRLEINAAELINRAFMFKDALQLFYETRGTSDEFNVPGGWKEINQSRRYTVNEEYTFVSQTAGEIKGGDVNISLSGNLIQDENSGALIRAQDEMNRAIYSNITAADGLKISAGNIYNYGGLQSGGLMDINAANDFMSYDAKLVAGSLKIFAGHDYYNGARVEFHEFSDSDGDGQFYINDPYVNGYGIFMVSAGDSEIRSGNLLSISGIQGTIRGNSNITMKNDGVFKSITYDKVWRVKVYKKGGLPGKIQGKIEGKIEILGNSTVVSENGSIKESGYVKEIGGDSTTQADKDIIIESILQKEETAYQSVNEDKLFGNSEKNITRHVKITNIGSSTKVGGNLELIAGNNINVLASSLESLAGIVSLTAGMDINVLAGEDYEGTETVKTKSGTFGFGKEDSESSESETKTAASVIKGQGVVIKAGNGAVITASDIESGQGGTMITAGNDINVLSETEVSKSKSSKESGNALTGSEMTMYYNEEGIIRGTNMKSVGNITLVSGKDITSISGNYEAVGDVNKIAGYAVNDQGVLEKSGKSGNVREYAAENYAISERFHEKTDGLLGAFTSIDAIISSMNPFHGFADGWEAGFRSILNPLDRSINIDIGLQGISASVSLKKETEREKTEERISKVNEIISGGNISLKASEDVTSIGTQMSAEGDINIEGNNILMLSAQNSVKSELSREEHTITTGMKVGNAYVDVGFAAKGLYDAEQALEKAAYELREMEKLNKEGKASNEAVEDARINVAMATANVANATISLAASAAGAATAASSSYGTGLYAAGFANYDTNKLSVITENTYATQGNLFANNINFKSANDMMQEGTNVYANNKITYDIGNGLTIKASKDTMTSERKSEHLSGGVSVGNNAVQVSASAGQSSERMRATSYSNSESIAKDIVMNVGNNAVLSGANVHASNDLTANIGNNLTVESLQDTYYAKGNSWDANVSVGIGPAGMGNFLGGSKSNAGNKSIGAGFNVGNSYTDSAWVGEQTTLTSANNANITAGNKTTVTGAVIGSESNNLTLNTKELEYSGLQDKEVSRSKGFGVRTSIGGNLTDRQDLNLSPSGSTSLSLKNTGSEKERVNKATIGEGTIIVDGSALEGDALAGLNRDLSKTQSETKERITNALDGSVTVDNRVFTSAGRASIAGDFENFDNNLGQIFNNITMNNIIVQVLKETLSDKNSLNLGGALKQYLGLEYDTREILDNDKLNKEINGLTNLNPEGAKDSLREMGEVYNEDEDLKKINLSTVDIEDKNGIKTINLSNLDMTDPNAIAGKLGGLGASDKTNADSRGKMASAIMDMMNYGNANTNTMTTEQWLSQTKDGISYANSLFDRTWDPISNERISTLDPRVQNWAADFVNETKDKLGINLRITSAYRSIEEQDATYAKGRRGIPGEKIVTDAKGGKSYHNYGLAIDVVAMEKNNRYANYGIVPSNLDLIGIGNRYGFDWGIRLKDGTIDTPHFQTPFGQKPSELYKQYLDNKEKK
ncbi:MAG: hemagglutinin repeat-containing protein [Endomicrobium sp.]|jgi:filamentous hemagglutinin|nr:hemagglutinin repeat-containing protein [Endomicrobium sp.]